MTTHRGAQFSKTVATLELFSNIVQVAIVQYTAIVEVAISSKVLICAHGMSIKGVGGMLYVKSYTNNRASMAKPRRLQEGLLICSSWRAE